MQKRICFLANGGKTTLYSALKASLEAHGVLSYFITTNRDQYKWLKERYDDEYLLYSPITFSKKAKEFPDIKINELIRGDRILRYDKDAQHYLTLYLEEAYEFIIEKDIDLVTGELTWAHEIALKRLIDQKGTSKFYVPIRTRLPDDRIVFSTSEFNSQYLEFDNNIEGIQLRNERPKYINASIKRSKTLLAPKTFFYRFTKLFNSSYDSKDLMYARGFRNRFRKSAKPFVNKLLYSFVKRVNKTQFDKKYVLITLHKQPESSIDVLGRYYEDQFLIVESLWKVTPPDILILVKPHALALGDQPLSFYQKIQKLGNNIIMLHEDVNTHDLLNESCKSVVSISGTIALEASLKGILAFTFNHIFFSNKMVVKVDFERFRAIDSFDELHGLRNQEAQSGVSDHLLKSSFKADISDPTFNPHVLHEDNLENLTNALIQVIQIYC